ncbi:MAG: OmpA family protein [Bacteroidota bacterium]
MKKIFSYTALLLLLALFSEQVQAQYLVYKEDRDGDGVPDIRDKCPDTDKNLRGHEFKVEHKGQTFFVKIGDIKQNFETRKRRMLIELGRYRDERRKLMKPIDGRKDKMHKLDQASLDRIAEIDTLIAKKEAYLGEAIFEARINVDGTEEVVDVLIGVDEFGCMPDKDNDGIPDMVDKCPDDPGIRKYNGCNDRDGDGVIDPEDECPDEPGLVELKGCPDRGTGDRDGDKVIDKDDVCPDTPGTIANKGCPEILDEKEKEIVNAASKVLFDSGRSTLRPESKSILDQLADLIFKKTEQFGKLRIRLEGHTDTDGSGPFNLTLSRNRSRAVKNYLVTKGVDFDSIMTAGYGEGRLKVSPERTPADKQANRRVEITITNEE